MLGMAAALVLAACDSPGEPGSRVPAQLLLVRGDTQTAAAGQRVADSVVVRVLNRRGEALGGVEVEFAGTPGGGTLSPRRVGTDADGSARAAWTLGTAAGAQTAQARVRGRAPVAVVFTARATAGVAANLVAVSGSGQSGRVGEALAQPLVVRVTDAYGNGVAGRPVAWSAAGGELVPAAERTDTSGFARATWTLGTVAGIQANAAHASVDGDSARFDAVAVPGPAVRIGILPDSLVMVHPARFRMEAAAYDAYGNRIWSASAFSWSVSDPALAIIEPDPVSSHVTVITRAVGRARIHAGADGFAGSMFLGVAGTEGRYLRTPAGGTVLNDRGESAEMAGPSTLAVWRDGRARYFEVAQVNDHRASVTGIANDGAVLVFYMNQRPHGLSPVRGFTHLVREGVEVGSIVGMGLGINGQGHVVGSRDDRSPGSPAGFLLRDGKTLFFTELTRERMDTRAVAINNRGQVAINRSPLYGEPGCMPVPDCWSTVHLWEEGRYTLIPRPDQCASPWRAVDLNNLGHVLVSCGGESPRALLWDGSVLIDLAPIFHAGGLNDRDEVVGWGRVGAYLWRRGEGLHSLPINGARINNAGQILAGGLYTPVKGGEDCTLSCVPAF